MSKKEKKGKETEKQVGVSLEQQIVGLREENEQLKRSNTSLKGEVSKRGKRINELTNKLHAYHEEKNKAIEGLDNAIKAINNLKGKLKEVQEQYEAEKHKTLWQRIFG